MYATLFLVTSAFIREDHSMINTGLSPTHDVKLPGYMMRCISETFAGNLLRHGQRATTEDKRCTYTAYLVILIQLAVCFFRSPKEFKFRIWQSVALPTIVRVLDFAHAPTTLAATVVLTVYENPIPSTNRLEADLSIEVGSKEHSMLHLLAIISMISFVFSFQFGMATLLLRKAWKLKHTRYGIQMKTNFRNSCQD